MTFLGIQPSYCSFSDLSRGPTYSYDILYSFQPWDEVAESYSQMESHCMQTGRPQWDFFSNGPRAVSNNWLIGKFPGYKLDHITGKCVQLWISFPVKRFYFNPYWIIPGAWAGPYNWKTHPVVNFRILPYYWVIHSIMDEFSSKTVLLMTRYFTKTE